MHNKNSSNIGSAVKSDDDDVPMLVIVLNISHRPISVKAINKTIAQDLSTCDHIMKKPHPVW